LAGKRFAITYLPFAGSRGEIASIKATLPAWAEPLAPPVSPWHGPCNSHGVSNFTKEIPMLSYAITFFIIALLAGIFGFWGVAGLAAEIAKILCAVFVVLMIVSLLRGGGPRSTL
jgi:uncharacterized membrane protein YtjA (UPF0391 family)